MMMTGGGAGGGRAGMVATTARRLTIVLCAGAASAEFCRERGRGWGPHLHRTTNRGGGGARPGGGQELRPERLNMPAPLLHPRKMHRPKLRQRRGGGL